MWQKLTTEGTAVTPELIEKLNRIKAEGQPPRDSPRRGGLIPPPASRKSMAQASERISSLEAQVKALREELDDLKRQTLGYRWAATERVNE